MGEDAHKGPEIVAMRRAGQRRGVSDSLAAASTSPMVREQSQELDKRKLMSKQIMLKIPAMQARGNRKLQQPAGVDFQVC